MRRLATIVRKLASHGFGFVVHRLRLHSHLPTWLRIPGVGPGGRPENMAKEFADLLEELGPTFVKFGQMLATRPDILPPEYIAELERVYHDVAPFPADRAREMIEEELGKPVEEVFREFEGQPVASGSIAQVHGATLQDGTPAVVKVRRPEIEHTIEDDLAILQFLADQADKVEEFKSFRLPMLVEEFGRGIQRELDFVAEAAYTHRFRDAFRDDERLQTPEVFWELTTPRVLVLRRLSGTHMSDLLRRGGAGAGWNRRELAHTVMDAYLRQFFILGIFHGDPHPGNILVTRQGKVGLLDFGLVGRVNARLRRDLGVCLLALGGGQLELVADVLSDVGKLPEQANEYEFREEVTDLLTRYSSVPLERMDFQRSFYELMGVIRKYNVRVPRDFVLMGRALVEISGIVTQLDPTLDIASVAEPYARKLMRHKFSAQGVRNSLTSAGYHVGTLLTEGPREVRRLLSKLRRGIFEFTIRHEGFEEALGELDKTGNRLALSILLAAIIMASTSLLTSGIRTFGFIGLAFGFMLGVWLIIGILRSRSV